jgi:hypothetical protein
MVIKGTAELGHYATQQAAAADDVSLFCSFVLPNEPAIGVPTGRDRRPGEVTFQSW